MKGDELLSDLNIDAISVIKIDVEEAKIFVLRGWRETIKKFRPYIYIEILDTNGVSERIKRKDEICELLLGLNYKRLGVHENNKTLTVIEDTNEVGRCCLQEYIFCPAERVGEFRDAIKFNASGVNVG